MCFPIFRLLDTFLCGPLSKPNANSPACTGTSHEPGEKCQKGRFRLVAIALPSSTQLARKPSFSLLGSNLLLLEKEFTQFDIWFSDLVSRRECSGCKH